MLNLILVITLVSGQITAMPTPYHKLKDCADVGRVMLLTRQANRFQCFKVYDGGK